jgi:peptidoglycan/LPS O-acetylase OafA/YrhL
MTPGEDPVRPTVLPLTAAERRELREGVDRTFIVRLVLAVMALVCLAGVVALIVLGGKHSDDIIDLVAYGLAPFAGIAGGIAAYYYTRDRGDLDQRWITRFVLIAIVVECVLALAALSIEGGPSYTHVKNVLSYGLAPLTAIAGAIGTYYFTK